LGGNGDGNKAIIQRFDGIGTANVSMNFLENDRTHSDVVTRDNLLDGEVMRRRNKISLPHKGKVIGNGDKAKGIFVTREQGDTTSCIIGGSIVSNVPFLFQLVKHAKIT